MWSDNLERALFFRERNAVHRICDDDVAIENSGVELSQRKYDAIAVRGFLHNVSGHGYAAKMFAAGNAGLAQNFFEWHAFIGLFFCECGLTTARLFGGMLFRSAAVRVSGVETAPPTRSSAAGAAGVVCPGTGPLKHAKRRAKGKTIFCIGG